MGESISSQVHLLDCLFRSLSCRTRLTGLLWFPKTIDTCRQSATSINVSLCHPERPLPPHPENLHCHAAMLQFSQFRKGKARSLGSKKKTEESEERRKWHSKAAEKSWLQSKTLSKTSKGRGRGRASGDTLKASHKKIKRTANMENLKWSQVSDSCSHWELETKVRKGIVRCLRCSNSHVWCTENNQFRQKKKRNQNSIYHP